MVVGIKMLPNRAEKQHFEMLSEIVTSLQNELTVLHEWQDFETKNQHSTERTTADKLLFSWRQRSKYLTIQLDTERRMQNLANQSLCDKCVEESNKIS